MHSTVRLTHLITLHNFLWFHTTPTLLAEFDVIGVTYAKPNSAPTILPIKSVFKLTLTQNKPETSWPTWAVEFTYITYMQNDEQTFK
jgi:hypothetical protein